MTSDDSSDHVRDALPARQEKRPLHVCPHCGSDDLSKGLKLDADMDAGTLGVSYKAAKLLGLPILGREQLYLDLCNSCGTVARFFVKNADRDWHG
jgi:hypothetical protein